MRCSGTFARAASTVNPTTFRSIRRINPVVNSGADDRWLVRDHGRVDSAGGFQGGGQELIDLVDRADGEFGAHVAEVRQWVELLSPTTGDEAAEDGCGATTLIAAGRQPVLAAQLCGPNRVLGWVVVDGQVTLIASSRFHRPNVTALSPCRRQNAACQRPLRSHRSGCRCQSQARSAIMHLRRHC